MSSKVKIKDPLTNTAFCILFSTVVIVVIVVIIAIFWLSVWNQHSNDDNASNNEDHIWKNGANIEPKGDSGMGFSWFKISSLLCITSLKGKQEVVCDGEQKKWKQKCTNMHNCVWNFAQTTIIMQFHLRNTLMKINNCNSSDKHAYTYQETFWISRLGTFSI